jgi:1-aminocyclopropane-1-carboxylate deaminase/D-cysteine desulfhydrase-like pyridoxal-dependent ACC family enzyme|tara:strand:- start:265 stop:510 length:246 start_codon:yes stop_codon:yes gene_type:complete
MALSSSELKKVGGASPAIWYYKSADAIGAITTSGYFNDVTTNLKQFDIILVVSATGGTAAVDVITVSSTTGNTTVTTTALA